ncbi:MAG: molybdopterin-containing oxidoreductase family protein [Syntrophobacteraceae bacterium]
MAEIHKTSCVLCAQNCGLDALVQDNRIVKTRGDGANARSNGYACRKGLNVAMHQHNSDRLKFPLKRTENGFERISWEQAIDEIAVRLKEIVAVNGPRSLAYMGGGGQGCHFEAAFGVRLLRALGSQYHYSALAQEFSGMFWVHGRTLGRQYIHLIPDIDNTDLMVAIGWNGMQSHQIPQAPRRLQRLSKDPDKLLIVIDPRLSETAKIADIHLAIRPGADALLLKAMIALVLREGWENKAYLEEHTSSFDIIRPIFENFDYRAAIATCELDFDRVREVCRLFSSRKSCLRYDLGVMMNRHSAAASYLALIFQALCGRIGVKGGSVIPGHIMPMGSSSDEFNPKTWRTVATGFFPVAGTYPPNCMPEEILSESPERLRAVIVSGANPLRSYADTTAYEQAFKRLDLLVTTEVAMTETARLSHYVLPARSGYESWDGTFFAMTFPGIFFQMRRPIVEPEGEALESGEIFVRLADRLGLIPPIPDSLHEAARAGRERFAGALGEHIAKAPGAARSLPFIVAKTLGKALGSVHLAALWGMLQTAPASFRQAAARCGFEPGPGQGEEIFRKILDHPEGIWAGELDPERNFEQLKTQDVRVCMHIPELVETIKRLDGESEEQSLKPLPGFPLILMAGKHTGTNANTLMRNPAWIKGWRGCTLAMHPEDAKALKLEDGHMARVTTEAGSELVELEITTTARKGQVSMPHGFGLMYEGKIGGVNVNRLTKNTHRDHLGTPMHRYVPCRVEAV